LDRGDVRRLGVDAGRRAAVVHVDDRCVAPRSGAMAGRLRDDRLDCRHRRLRISLRLGHDRLQAVELLTGPRYFAVAKPMISPTSDPGRMISQKYGPPSVTR